MSSSVCYNCNETGHFARECSRGGGGGAGFRGSHGGQGSLRRGGSVGGGSGQHACYNCNTSGHIARDCPESKSCYNCGKSGHMSRECDTPDNRGSGGGGRGGLDAKKDGFITDGVRKIRVRAFPKGMKMWSPPQSDRKPAEKAEVADK